MDLVKQLRTLIAAVDPALLTVEDRLALVDLIERAFTAKAEAAQTG